MLVDMLVDIDRRVSGVQTTDFSYLIQDWKPWKATVHPELVHVPRTVYLVLW